MSAIYVEVQNYGDGKILKTPTGKYQYMNSKREVSKASYDNVGELLDGEKLRNGTKAKQVQRRQKASERTEDGGNGNIDVVTPIEEQQALVEAAVEQADAGDAPTEKPAKPAATRKRSTRKK